jgi:SapC
MVAQLLIYEKAVPVNPRKHGDWSIKTGTDYSFAKNVNSVPLMAAEFPSAGGDYAIVFTGNDDEIMPSVILGIRDQQNLQVSEDGKWQAKYIPAFIRRYPFVFSSSDDGATFTLCIDEDFAGCNQEGIGERLFDSEGARTQYLENVLGFLREFQSQFMRTQVFCRKLKELDLLEPMQAQISVRGDQPLSLTGFMAVNREKLKEVPGDKLAELAKTDELELIYTHLQSMRNFSPMAAEAASLAGAAGDTAPAAPETDAPAEAEKKPAGKKRSTSKAGT